MWTSTIFLYLAQFFSLGGSKYRRACILQHPYTIIHIGEPEAVERIIYLNFPNITDRILNNAHTGMMLFTSFSGLLHSRHIFIALLHISPREYCRLSCLNEICVCVCVSQFYWWLRKMPRINNINATMYWYSRWNGNTREICCNLANTGWVEVESEGCDRSSGRDKLPVWWWKSGGNWILLQKLLSTLQIIKEQFFSSTWHHFQMHFRYYECMNWIELNIWLVHFQQKHLE